VVEYPRRDILVRNAATMKAIATAAMPHIVTYRVESQRDEMIR
jgi:hypothetical protein